MRRVTLWLILMSVSSVLAGCGAPPAPTTIVSLDALSPTVLEAAQKTLPDVKFSSARTIQFRGEEVFEIRGQLPNGKIREVKVSIDGKVVQSK